MARRCRSGRVWFAPSSGIARAPLDEFRISADTYDAMSSATPIDGLDGARGSAMLLVFLSHFAGVYYERAAPGSEHHLLTLVTLVASPTFVWISGMMLGVLYHRHRQDFASVRNRYVDRGLFLLLVAHPLIAITMWSHSGSHAWSAALEKVFITDTLGIAFVVGSFLVSRFGPRALVWLGGALLVTAWLLLVCWTPGMPSWQWALKDLLVG